MSFVLASLDLSVSTKWLYICTIWCLQQILNNQSSECRCISSSFSLENIFSSLLMFFASAFILFHSLSSFLYLVKTSNIVMNTKPYKPTEYGQEWAWAKNFSITAVPLLRLHEVQLTCFCQMCCLKELLKCSIIILYAWFMHVSQFGCILSLDKEFCWLRLETTPFVSEIKLRLANFWDAISKVEHTISWCRMVCTLLYTWIWSQNHMHSQQKVRQTKRKSKLVLRSLKGKA